MLPRGIRRCCGLIPANGLTRTGRTSLQPAHPQAAIDAPRWQVFEGRDLGVEDGFAAPIVDELCARGHRVRVLGPTLFGGAQAIWRLDGGYAGASDPRKDGMAAGY